MYKKFIRPILFLFPPEAVHKFTVFMLRVGCRLPGGRRLLHSMFSVKEPALELDVFGIKFDNPVGLAAGFDKNASSFKYLEPLGFGFIELGTVTPRPQPGNLRPRLFRLPKDRALVNRMGFNNNGLEAMAANLRKNKPNVRIGISIGKNTMTANEGAVADYLKVFRSLYDHADYFAVNVSCPNVKDLTALQNRAETEQLLAALFEFRRGQEKYRPILLKISPDLSFEQVDTMIDILIDTPLDGIIATNTSTSRQGLATDPARIDQIGNGGLSGAPLTVRSREMVRYIHERTGGQYPIIGCGGIMTPEDAQQMLRAGATLVQIYTGLIYEGPTFVSRICRRLLSKK